MEKLTGYQTHIFLNLEWTTLNSTHTHSRSKIWSQGAPAISFIFKMFNKIRVVFYNFTQILEFKYFGMGNPILGGREV